MRPDIPADLAALVHRMLAKRPADRPATPAEVAEALAPWCEGCDLARLAAQGKDLTAAVETEVRSHTTTPHLSSHATDTTSHRAVELGDSAFESCGSVTADRQEAVTQPRPTRRRVSWKPLAIAAGIVGVIALAAVFMLRTPNGTVEIVLAEGVEAEDVEVVVRQSGKQVQVADAKQGWTIRLEDGKYDLDLKGSSDRFQLEKQTVTVQRREKQIVRITLKPDDQTAADRQIAKAPVEPTQSPSEDLLPSPRLRGEGSGVRVLR